jgi:DNA topoisomerase II
MNNFRKKGFAPLKKQLEKYNLINNKHIPKEYIINSKEIRLQLLAGIIDTDGTVFRNGTRIQISQGHIHKQLIYDILYLARSLGFCCSIRSFITKYKLKNNEIKESLAYIINISGNIEDIPTKLPRKKCNNTKKQNTDKSTGQITITEKEESEYIGIKIDGNERFLINDFTVTHNCTNIFSIKFIVETVDTKNHLKFIQEYSNNMSEKSKPRIHKSALKKGYTKISFIPDYKRFGFDNGLDDDLINLIEKRIYDSAGTISSKVSFFINGEKILHKGGFIDYARLYNTDKNIDVIYEKQNININDNQIGTWEYMILTAPNNEFDVISFVNGEYTKFGGKHVDYVLNQILDELKNKFLSKKINIKYSSIKDNIIFIIKSIIVNPQFNSQTKDTLTTQYKDFGTSFKVSESFIGKVWKSDFIKKLITQNKEIDIKKLNKTDGKHTSNIHVLNLEDADFAGTTQSKKCSLILTEGLSAKTFAMWGRSITNNGNKYFGVFPLKGKLLNVRNATNSQLLNNDEINNLKKIIGLKHGKDYSQETDLYSLRYGKILCLTDSDYDGIHITSLIINFIHAFWPSLIKQNFIQILRTPIIKVIPIKNKKTIEFYTQKEYEKWKGGQSPSKKDFSIKYYKGLGTSTKKEAQDIFKNYNNLCVNFTYNDDKCDAALLLAFDKDKNKSKKGNNIKMADKRKEWLKNYDKNVIDDNITSSNITYNEYINNHLIQFSIYDNMRSIPNIYDGLKPSQRKILYYMLKNNIIKQIKVAQLSGYISAEMAYHHGEPSLQQAIINMAQDFIGTNNINLLEPCGNFGSRLISNDAASARYIFTNLTPSSLLLYNSIDLNLLNYLNDDGIKIEPEYFIPILPMVLVNGSEGIGTGFSTYIPPHNPHDIIDNIKNLLNGISTFPMKPFFKNFKGKIIEASNCKTKFTSCGIWKRLNEHQIEITELPVYTYISPYKEFLEEMVIDGKIIKKIQNKTRDENVDINFVIDFKNEKVLNDLIEKEQINKVFKLESSFNTSNMYVFTKNNTPNLYKSSNDILIEFYEVRFNLYKRRKEYIIKTLEYELDILGNKKRFIEEYKSKSLNINDRKRNDLIADLISRKYTNIDNYDYLLNMPFISLTFEKIAALNEKIKDKTCELNMIKNKSIKDLWMDDLNELKKTI